MLVTTNAPIYEEKSSANGKSKRPKGRFRKKLATGFQKGYSKVKEAGAFPVIENLLGLSTGSGTTPIENYQSPTTPIETPSTKMTTTTKVLVGVVVLGAIVGAYFYFKKSGKSTPNVKLSK